MDENILFFQHGVRVSLTQFVVHGHGYAIDEITAIKLDTVDFKHSPELLCIVLGVALLFTEGALFLFGLFSIIAGAVGFFTTQTSYSLMMETAAGEKRVLTSHDRQYMEQLMAALQIAMVSNRQQLPEQEPIMSTLAPG